MTTIKRVLSIQSHVAYGYAGNKAAVFPLQKLGIDVTPIHTVQLSNHTGYDYYNGDFFHPQQIQAIIDGLAKNDLLNPHCALISGYIGNKEIAKIIAELVRSLKRHNPDFIYLCDPVFGDSHTGIYASSDHPDLFKSQLLPLANISTPNLFELSVLTNTNIHDLHDLEKACLILQQTGVDTIVVTSVSFDDKHTGIAVYDKGAFFYEQMPKYTVAHTVSGSGDITAALFLAYGLNGLNLTDRLKKTMTAIDGIFNTTSRLNAHELALIQAQNYISNH
ncbi:MAG: pyridoxal kinase [Francisellaceae bacterium]